MRDRKEQYLWITFGNEGITTPVNCCREKSNVLIGLGYHEKPGTKVMETNDYCSSNRREGVWVEKRYAFDPSAAHQVKLTVSAEEYELWMDGERQIAGPLPLGYLGGCGEAAAGQEGGCSGAGAVCEGGYVGIGTGYTGTEIKDIRINGCKAEFSSCAYFAGSQNEGLKREAGEFYEKQENGYTRIFNGCGQFLSNIPMLYFGERFSTFTLEFELRFAEAFDENASAPRELADPFGTYSFGPYPLKVFAQWEPYGKVYETALHEDCVELKLCTPPWAQTKRSLFLSCPSVGGIRISSQPPKKAAEAFVGDTAVFEPEFSLPVDRKQFQGELTGADGTRGRVVLEGDYWGIEIYNREGKRVQTIHNWNLSRSDDRFVTRQYALELPLLGDEVIFGTGERYNHFNQHGCRMCFWNTDMCYHGYSSLKTHELWRSYKNVPVVNSSRGITYFFNTACYGEGDFGYSDRTRMKLTFDDSRLDVYIFTGAPLENLVKYTDLTGKPLLPPKWAFRYQAGGSNDFWGFGQNRGKEYPRKLLREMIDGFRKMGTLPSAIYMEGGGADDPACYEMCAEAEIRVLQWNCGDFMPGFMHEHYPDKTYQELPMVKNIFHPEEVHYFGDFTHKDAPGVLKSIHGERIGWGLRGGMVDFNELVPVDARFANGLLGDKMHNFWVWWYAKAYHDLYAELADGDYLCYMRGACAGSQKWNCTWTGDQMNSFDGLKQQIAGGLSLSASGFSVWGTDMGGLTGKPSDEVYIRAFQFCTFLPLMRTGGNATKLPWDYGEQVGEVFQRFYWLRENLLDTIYSGAIHSHRTGEPMTQAMALAFPECREAAGNEEQYLFCGSLLFAPVFQEGAVTKEMYFPEGGWYSLFDDTVIEESGWRIVPAPLAYSPAYVRDGAVLPVTLGDSLELGSPMPGVRRRGLLLAPPKGERRSVMYLAGDKAIEAGSAPAGEKEFVVELTEGGSFEAAVIFGEAKEVVVDGRSLPRCEGPMALEAEETALEGGIDSGESLSGRGEAAAEGFTVRGRRTYVWLREPGIRILRVRE